MSAFIKGFTVIKIEEGESTGKAVSRVFHAKQAAEDFRALAQKTDSKSRYFVADRVGYDKGKGDIK